MRGKVERETSLLASSLEHPDFRVREKATAKLASFGDIAVRRLFPLLSSPSPEVRSRVNRILSRMLDSPFLMIEAFRSGEEGVSWIDSVTPADPDRKSSFHVEMILGAGFYGGPELIPLLARRAASGEPHAANSLGMLGCPGEAFEELVELSTPENTPRILRAIGTTAAVEARDYLKAMLHSPDEPTREAAAASMEILDRIERAEKLAILLARLPGSKKRILSLVQYLDTVEKWRFADRFLRESIAMPADEAVELLESFRKLNIDPRLFSFRRCAHLIDEITAHLEIDPTAPGSWWLCTILAGYPENVRAMRAIFGVLAQTDGNAYLDSIYEQTGDFGLATVVEARLSHFPGSAKLPLDAFLRRPPGALGRAALGVALESHDAGFIREAARLLASFPGPETVEVLVHGMENPSGRRICMRALAGNGKAAGFERLALLATEGCPGEVYTGLGDTGDPRAAPILRAACANRQSARFALVGLGRLGDRKNLDLLVTALWDDRLWKFALQGLETLGAVEAVPALKAFISSAIKRNSTRRAWKAKQVLYRISNK